MFGFAFRRRVEVKNISLITHTVQTIIYIYIFFLVLVFIFVFIFREY